MSQFPKVFPIHNLSTLIFFNVYISVDHLGSTPRYVHDLIYYRVDYFTLIEDGNKTETLKASPDFAYGICEDPDDNLLPGIPKIKVLD
jgi:hypothetical protein